MDPSPQLNPQCYLHPKELVVGVCALCLKERLLSLAATATQCRRRRRLQFKDTHRTFAVLRRKSAIIFPRVFALGSSLLHRRESLQPHKTKDDDESSISSLEDSFISIKFEGNGQALWDNKKPTANVEPSKSVVETTKALRWRKRFGQLLQMARWKKSSKAGTCHVGLAEVVKGRRGGWIRSLTHRRTTSATD